MIGIMWSSSFISQFAIINYKFSISSFIIIYLFKIISKLTYKNILYIEIYLLNK